MCSSPFASGCSLLPAAEGRCWDSSDFGQLGYGSQNEIGDDETPAEAYATLPNGGDVEVF